MEALACVLIVDDAADIRLLERDALERAGIHVIEAASGLEAIQKSTSSPRPDMVILDVQMPDLDGWDTLATLRRRAATSATPVILCTVRAGPSDALRAWQLGADAYIVKPFAVAEFVAAARSVLGRTEAQRLSLRHERHELAVRQLMGPDRD